MDVKKKENETELAYMARLYRNKIELNLTNKEINEIINKELGSNYAESTTRCNSNSYNQGYNDGFEEALSKNSSEELKELELKQMEIKKERKKIQTINVELNKNLREQARNELWIEQLEDKIKSLKPLDIPELTYNTETEKDGLLIISDCHYGRKCEIKGLNGEIISKYNTNEFKTRMWNLLEQVVEDCEERNLNHLSIFNLGDFIDGILRVSQLKSLQEGVIDSTLEYSEFISTWLNELSKYITIDYYQCNGNHDEVRVLTGKKNDFPHEQVGKIIHKFIKIRLENNENIKIHDCNNDMIYTNILGVNVLGYHGEDKNLINSIRYFRSLYKQPIDIIFGGHLHRTSIETEGIAEYGNCECIRVSSICGVDDYSTKLQKASRAGASMFIFKKGKGKVSQDDFWLN